MTTGNTMDLLDKLERTEGLEKEEWMTLIDKRTPDLEKDLFLRAQKTAQKYYGKDIYLRGLIEFTNICRNNCTYCGLRRDNGNVHRYRLTKEQILSCCRLGYQLDFRTFVLQGGEDGYFLAHAEKENTDGSLQGIDLLADIISGIKSEFPDCAITLSVGELPKEDYRKLFLAGADRYLLRHETYDADHYHRLHPPELSPERRQQCLWDLKEIGFQVGTGMMVGSPYQTTANLADDLLFMKKLNPAMVGIGPFIPHHDTPFKDQPAGTAELTLFLLACIRLMLPKVLLPATTALGTIDPEGREKGVLAGANVIMPNLSPTDVRKDYLLYDNKICTGDEAAECRKCLARRMEKIGYHAAVNRGDSKNI